MTTKWGVRWKDIWEVINRAFSVSKYRPAQDVEDSKRSQCASAPKVKGDIPELHPQVISSDTSNKTLQRMNFSGINSVLMVSFDDAFQIYNGESWVTQHFTCEFHSQRLVKELALFNDTHGHNIRCRQGSESLSA